MGILCAGLSDIGLIRKQNQDSILLHENGKLFVVADGMGGHKGGEVASQLAVEEIEKRFNELSDEDPEEILKSSIENANAAIFHHAQNNENLKGMGTTVVGLFFKGSQAYIGNVGDSRAYLINKGNIYQLTRDHSLINEKLNIGLYNREQAEKDPNKNVLARSCGIANEVKVDIFTYKVKKKDFFLLCSDGLSGLIDDQQIMRIVSKHFQDNSEISETHLDMINQELVDLAKDAGGHDNISIITVLAY